jgi:putative ABC transport system permease protein
MNALKLNPGQEFSLITTREGGAIDGASYAVRGAFETVFKDFDDRAAKISLKSAQQLLGIPDKVHTLLVILDNTENSEKVRDSLTRLFQQEKLDLEIFSWSEVDRFYESSRQLLDKIYTTVFLIIGVVFFFSIANTINMSLLERTREFGTMMALGNTRLLIGLTVVSEASILGLIGATLGIAFGAGFAMIVSSIGIEMPPPPQATSGYYAMISLNPPLLTKVFLMAFISTALASFTPAYRVCHQRIVQALEYV